MTLVVFLISFIAAFCLGSIIEWFVHKELMHSVQFMKTPHLRHAVEHHAERKAPGKYYAKADELKEYHLFETSFMPHYRRHRQSDQGFRERAHFDDRRVGLRNRSQHCDCLLYTSDAADE